MQSNSVATTGTGGIMEQGVPIARRAAWIFEQERKAARRREIKRRHNEERLTGIVSKYETERQQRLKDKLYSSAFDEEWNSFAENCIIELDHLEKLDLKMRAKKTHYASKEETLTLAWRVGRLVRMMIEFHASERRAKI